MEKTKSDLFIQAEKEISKAYSDCHDYGPDDYPTKESMAERNLNFFCDFPFTIQEAYEMADRYIGQYNAFEPELLLRLEDLVCPSSMVKIAREGSVCVYVQCDCDRDYDMICDALCADECDSDKKGLRIWWD